jgi:hypothetical protein
MWLGISCNVEHVASLWYSGIIGRIGGWMPLLWFVDLDPLIEMFP